MNTTLEQIIENDPTLKTLVQKDFDTKNFDWQVDLKIGALKVALGKWLNENFN